MAHVVENLSWQALLESQVKTSWDLEKMLSKEMKTRESKRENEVKEMICVRARVCAWARVSGGERQREKI